LYFDSAEGGGIIDGLQRILQNGPVSDLGSSAPSGAECLLPGPLYSDQLFRARNRSVERVDVGTYVLSICARILIGT
jgi:hypothetical protein